MRVKNTICVNASQKYYRFCLFYYFLNLQLSSKLFFTSTAAEPAPNFSESSIALFSASAAASLGLSYPLASASASGGGFRKKIKRWRVYRKLGLSALALAFGKGVEDNSCKKHKNKRSQYGFNHKKNKFSS